MYGDMLVLRNAWIATVGGVWPSFTKVFGFTKHVTRDGSVKFPEKMLCNA